MSVASSPLLLRRTVSLVQHQQHQQSHSGSRRPEMSREQLAQRLRHNWAIRDTQAAGGDLSAPATATFGGVGHGGGKSAAHTDTDLTNLGWLQNMNLMKLTPPTPPASPQPSSMSAAAAAALTVLGSEEVILLEHGADPLQLFALSQQHHPHHQQLSQHHYLHHHQLSQMYGRPQLHRAISTPAFVTSGAAGLHLPAPATTAASPLSASAALTASAAAQHHQQQLHQHHHQQLHHQQGSLIQLPPSAPPVPPSPDPEFATNASLRPPYSFSTLIYMALTSLTKSKMTLQEICDWIGANFAFYGCSTDQSWQSAVRYNLTLNRCFQRVPRRKDEAAGNKGGYWRLNSDHIGQLELSQPQHLQQHQYQQQHQHHHQLQHSASLNQIKGSNGSLAGTKRRSNGLHNYQHLDQHQHQHQHEHQSPLLSDHPAADKRQRRHADEDAWMSRLGLQDGGGVVETQVRDDPTLVASSLPPPPPSSSSSSSSSASAAASAEAAAAATAANGGLGALRGSNKDNCCPSSASAAGAAAAAAATASNSSAASAAAAAAAAAAAVEDERWLFEPDPADDEDARGGGGVGSGNGNGGSRGPALDMSNPDSLLDLTLHGMALPPPSWWSASVQSGPGCGGGGLSGSLNGLIGLPSTPSPIMQHEQEEWVDENLDVGALDNLLGFR